eukprot:2711666-Ditylum_brightwellii.AAC.1
MKSDIVKKYENTKMKISDCVLLKTNYSEDINEGKKGKSKKGVSEPDEKAGKNKVNKSVKAQELMKYAE